MIQPSFKTSMTGVPILKNTAIEADVERMLRDYNPSLLEMPQPLDVEDFSESYLGLSVHFDNLSHNGSIWGRMVFYNNQIPVYVPELEHAEYLPIEANTIVIDNCLLNEEREAAYRSTMMHECGHKVYHTQFYREEAESSMWVTATAQRWIPATACRQVDVMDFGSGGKRTLISDQDWLEHQAKYFSAAALMPAPAVRRVYDELEIGENMRVSSSKASEYDFIFWLSSIFRVSTRSAEVRIRQLKLDFDSVSAHAG